MGPKIKGFLEPGSGTSLQSTRSPWAELNGSPTKVPHEKKTLHEINNESAKSKSEIPSLTSQGTKTYYSNKNKNKKKRSRQKSKQKQKDAVKDLTNDMKGDIAAEHRDRVLSGSPYMPVQGDTSIHEHSKRVNERQIDAMTIHAEGIDDSKDILLDVKHTTINEGGRPESPRKQTIKRHITGEVAEEAESIISQAKENLKNQSQGNPSSPESIGVIDTHLTKSNFNLDGKISLFKFKSSKILVYDEQLNEYGDMSTVSGRLLGHGELEIFHLHNGDVSFLSCGRSIIYPLLPKLKILRTGFNEFILPLLNSKRYWKILVNSDNIEIINKLIISFQSVVIYRSLYYGSSLLDVQKLGEPDNNEKLLSADELSRILDTRSDKKPVQSKKTSVEASNGLPLSTPIPPYPLQHFYESRDDMDTPTPTIYERIPDSPPSPPFSPIQFDGLDDQLAEPSTEIAINNEAPIHDNYQHHLNNPTPYKDAYNALHEMNLFPSPTKQAFNTLNESFKKISMNENHAIARPAAKRIGGPIILQSNPFQAIGDKENFKKDIDSKSESSLDSLLDEYEENLSTTRSMKFQKSGQTSAIVSRSSSFIMHHPIINDTMHKQYRTDNARNVKGNLRTVNGEFPVTSLSEYNRLRNGTHSFKVRSRRSSRSDLYTSETNWMEPAFPTNSRKNQISFSASYHDFQNRKPDIGHIYRSITQRNLDQIIKKSKNDDAISVKSYNNTFNASSQLNQSSAYILPARSSQPKPGYARSIMSERTSHNHSQFSKRLNTNDPSISTPLKIDQHNGTRGRRLSLRPLEVYNIVSLNKREEPNSREIPQKKGFATRFFGW